MIRLESRPPNVEGKGRITIRDLVRNSLRMRPDRIIVGEVRGGETLDMLQAMSTGPRRLAGHRARQLRRGRGDAAADTRLHERGRRSPSRRCTTRSTRAVDVLVQLHRLVDGTRRIAEIAVLSSPRPRHLPAHLRHPLHAPSRLASTAVSAAVRPPPAAPRVGDRLYLAGEHVPAAFGVAHSADRTRQQGGEMTDRPMEPSRWSRPSRSRGLHRAVRARRHLAWPSRSPSSACTPTPAGGHGGPALVDRLERLARPACPAAGAPAARQRPSAPAATAVARRRTPPVGRRLAGGSPRPAPDLTPGQFTAAVAGAGGRGLDRRPPPCSRPSSARSPALVGRLGRSRVPQLAPPAVRTEHFITQLPELARMLANATQAGLALRTAVGMAAEELEAPAGEELAGRRRHGPRPLHRRRAGRAGRHACPPGN